MDDVSISPNMNSTSNIYELYPHSELIGYILYIASMVVYLVVFLLGTIGNGLVIWIAGFRMKKTTNSVWFLNLAIVDFLFSFFMPLIFFYYVLDFHWPFGTIMCKLYSAMTCINMFVSAFLLTAITIDQCVSVVYPVWSQNHRTPRLASLATLIIWLLALCASVPHLVFNETDVQHDGSIMCYNDYGYPSIFRIIFFIVFFILFAVIVFCYTVIVFKRKRNHTFIFTKPFKMISAVLISFFVCWFPFYIFNILDLSWYSNEVDTMLIVLIFGFPIVSCLTYLNSCVNPFLYVFMGKEVKGISRTSIQAALENAFSEDSPQTFLKIKSKTTVESS